MICRLQLANGWTVSISPDDTPPALCSVAAWPTSKDNQRLQDEDWFKFEPDRPQVLDRRCHCLEDMREALAKVAASPPPRGALN